MSKRITDLDRQIAADPRHPAQELMAEKIERENEDQLNIEATLESMAQLLIELFQRVGVLEQVLSEALTILRDNPEKPHSAAEQLGALLAPEEG